MKNVAAEHKTRVNVPIIMFKENSRVIKFNNPNGMTYIKVHIDGAAICTGCRCDYLLVSSDEHEEHFVELKGKNLRHAFEQLGSTIDRIGEYDGDRHAYVVSTNQAPALQTYVQKAKIEFKKKYKSSLDIKERQLEVKLN